MTGARTWATIVLALCVGLLAWGCRSEAATPEAAAPPTAQPTATIPAGIKVVNDVVYATPLDASASEWKLDIYAPAETGTGPVVVFAHGFGANRKGYVEFSQALALRGAIVFTLDYPTFVEDIALQKDGRGVRETTEAAVCALRFATARAGEYGGDVERMVVGGHSYGGYISAWAALAGDEANEFWERFSADRGGPPPQLACAEPGGSARVRGLFGIGGAYNIWKVKRYWENDQELMELTDAYSHIGRNPHLQVRLILGEQDEQLFPHVEGFQAALAQAGYDAQIIRWDGEHSVPIELAVEQAIELGGIVAAQAQ
jgi:acetyl esterase/lipase